MIKSNNNSIENERLLRTQHDSVEPQNQTTIQSNNNDVNVPVLSRDLEDETGIPERTKLSIFRLIALTLCFLGVQFGWAVQIAYTSPLFLELGLPKYAVSFVWLAGPVSGLLVQPTVGVLSDRNTCKWGRRRPFILVGSISIVLGMLLISNATALGDAIMGERIDKVNTHNTHHSNVFGIILAICGFWLLDLSNNTVQGPCRALLVDVAAPSQQNLGGSLFSFMLGLGNLAGYYTGSLKLTEIMPFFGTDLRALFTVAMVVLLICVTITITITKETPRLPSPQDYAEEPIEKENPFVSIIKGVMTMPKPMRRVCLVQFFSWIAWFTFILYITTWVGENVYRGNPDAPEESEERKLFDDGVRAGAFGLTLNAAVTMISSVILPKVIDKVGIKPVYFISQIILSVCLTLPLWVNDRIGAIILICICGIPWSIVMVLPFTLVAMSVPEQKSGLYMGVLNIFVVVPQLLVSLTIGFLIRMFDGNLASALAAGGVAAFISALLVFTLIIPQKLGRIQVVGGGH